MWGGNRTELIEGLDVKLNQGYWALFVGGDPEELQYYRHQVSMSAGILTKLE